METVSQFSDKIYLSIRPKRCVQSDRRPHCLWAEHKMIGVNQNPTLSRVCFPEEVVQYPIKPSLDTNFPPRKEMHPTEKETLHDPEFKDILNTSNAKFSKFQILGAKKTYIVGDVIKVRIDMVDGYKRKRTVGGDDVRITVKSLDGRAASTGKIKDLKNGTYLGEIQLLWVGKSKIIVLLYHTREALSTQFKWRREYKELFYYYGQFSKGNSTEYTLCSVYHPVHGYRKLCNLTLLNRGYPWFCGHPLKPELNCVDFVRTNALDFLEIPMTPAQLATFDRLSALAKITGNVELDVKNGTKPNLKSKILCNKLPRNVTWDTTMPSGFFHQGQWNSLKCHNDVTKDNILNRLKNTTLLVAGDSTTRQWYLYFKDKLKCKQETQTWTNPKWYDITSCIFPSLNFRFRWLPHVLPFVNARKLKDGQLNLKSTRQILEEIPSKGKYIVIIHHYAHYIRQHYTLFRDVIRSLKPAIRNALKRNPDVKIAIKSPHSFHKYRCLSHLNDFAGPVFMDILKNELKDFYDSVWLLNYWEQTLAVENSDLHPQEGIVWENMKQMFGYTLM